ncbi:MAG: MaoC family dehydratase N-terminal domain-containing protein [Candidatus Tectomicrobia bacterium]|uniref:MaoC family dehydratase N-terminal domain-containing protein n=1 Tax=Tectimicrobiota bacterium TaxID=2528274 RepID=A0A932FZT9_UNCTE|nr:MaoC family dehydratase N-terminal domain-containing protein [Candidatus Tectomicrobia bacterium]
MSAKVQYFEDYEVGQEGVTGTRTVGAPDIVAFACLTCDYAPVHVDRHLTADGPYGGRIAHGLLGSSILTGLLSLYAPHIVGRNVPESHFYSFDTNYRGAIAIDDTIKIRWRVAEKRDDPDQPGFGFVATTFEVVNQEERSVYEGTVATKVRKREAQDQRLQFKAKKPWEIKELVIDPEKIYCLEDFLEGEGEFMAGRTFTEADVVNFVGLSGDYNPLYVDQVYAEKSSIGERIVPGMLAFTAAFGFWARDGALTQAKSPGEATDAGHLNDGATFLAPVKIGDTIRCLYKVDETRPSRTKPDRGILKFAFQMINQRNEVVQEGQTLMMRGTRATLKK